MKATIPTHLPDAVTETSPTKDTTHPVNTRTVKESTYRNGTTHSVKTPSVQTLPANVPGDLEQKQITPPVDKTLKPKTDLK